MMMAKRAISLDIGDRTVGVAVSDLLGMTAQGVETIRRTTLDADIARIIELMKEYDTNKIVSGYPRNMNGSEGPRCEFVKEFCGALQEAYPEADIEFWDERLSTVSATRSLLEADVSRKKRKKVIDKMAAVYILQGWLDRQSRF